MQKKMKEKELSKAISHALRHDPASYHIQLSKDGWVPLEELVEGLRKSTKEFSALTFTDITDLVEKAEKKRHEISNGLIRALHGHTLIIEQELASSEPPTFLYHATSASKYDLIVTQGLKPMERQYVHLATTREGALDVAAKKYKEVVLLQIASKEAFNSGIAFYSNNVDSIWLCKHLPPQNILLIDK